MLLPRSLQNHPKAQLGSVNLLPRVLMCYGITGTIQRDVNTMPNDIDNDIDNESEEHYTFASPSFIDNALNTLAGVIEGITVDSSINTEEVTVLDKWLESHREFQDRHPFNEVIPVVEEAMSDGVLTDDERDDIVWLCTRLQSTEFYDFIKADMQRLHAFLEGILADGVISTEELKGLADWVDEHEHLRACWPYDEVGSLVAAVLSDGQIHDHEHDMLIEYFSDFTGDAASAGDENPLAQEASLAGVCAIDPEIAFVGNVFCFAGKFGNSAPEEMSEVVSSLGGSWVTSLTPTTDYLVVGSEGNPCWAYACYGRQVEEAVTMRKQGSYVLLVHERDFRHAVANAKGN
jgi:hypothetical protein